MKGLIASLVLIAVITDAAQLNAIVKELNLQVFANILGIEAD